MTQPPDIESYWDDIRPQRTNQESPQDQERLDLAQFIQAAEELRNHVCFTNPRTLHTFNRDGHPSQVSSINFEVYEVQSDGQEVFFCSGSPLNPALGVYEAQIPNNYHPAHYRFRWSFQELSTSPIQQVSQDIRVPEVSDIESYWEGLRPPRHQETEQPKHTLACFMANKANPSGPRPLHTFNRDGHPENAFLVCFDLYRVELDSGHETHIPCPSFPANPSPGVYVADISLVKRDPDAKYRIRWIIKEYGSPNPQKLVEDL